MDLSAYISDAQAANSLDDYSQSPCEVFLDEILTIADAIDHCKANLPAESDATESALVQLTIAALGTIMGQLELYQRFTFSAAFELSRHVRGFELERCVKILEKDARLQLDVEHLSGYRGQPMAIGQLIADGLSAWHDPAKVNLYMSAIVRDVAFYSNSDVGTLKLLWQIRHSVVHTGGWVTLPDAQKHPDLAEHGGKAIFLSDKFTEAVARKLHVICIGATERLCAKLEKALPTEIASSREFKKFASVKTGKRDWLSAAPQEVIAK